MFGYKLNKNEYFYTVEVVSRYCDPQLQVGENLNRIA